MAASATTGASKCIIGRDFQSSPTKKIHRLNHLSFTTSPRKFQIKNSSDADASTQTEETPVEIQNKGLISSLNVEKALRGIAITETDHYNVLGIRRGCSYDEVTVAYKKRIDELMNEDEQVQEKVELLKESYLVLSNVEDRRLYDWSLARNENVDMYVWPFEVDITQKETQSPETPPAAEPQDEEPTRLVGYFFFAWLILGFTLSIALNI